MTDRIIAFTVTLEREIREDDAEEIAQAIRVIKGVLKVSGAVATPDTYAAREQSRRDLIDKIFEALKEWGSL